jgi:hypothetical protein
MLSIKQRLLILRWLTQFGFVMLVLGFLTLGMYALGIHILPQSFIVPILAIGFVLSIACSSLISFTRCPACHKPFIGNTSQGEAMPKPRLFTSVCQYCGHARTQISVRRRSWPRLH